MTVELGDSRLPPRFWERVTVDPTGCWLWIAHIDRKGYGKFKLDGDANSAHRIAYKVLVSSAIDGLDVDHLCRVRSCVNPAHLEAVTHAENIRRGRSGRPQAERTHCPQGHEYTPENTYFGQRRARKDGSLVFDRQCRQCKHDWYVRNVVNGGARNG